MARQTGKAPAGATPTAEELARRRPARLPERLEGPTTTFARIYERGEHDQGEMQQDIDRILARLDVEIPEAMKEMDALFGPVADHAHR